MVMWEKFAQYSPFLGCAGSVFPLAAGLEKEGRPI